MTRVHEIKTRIGEPFNPWREICGFYPPEILNRQRKLLGADGKLHRVTAGQKQLYDRCVRWTGDKVRFWRGFVSIAENLGRSDRQIKRDMAALESFALMRHRRRRWDTNVYEFLWHPIFEQVDSAPQEPGPKVTDTAHQEPGPKVTTVSRAEVTTVSRPKVTTVSRKSCQYNHVNTITSHTPYPQAPPSPKPDRKTGDCATAVARGVRSPISRQSAVSGNAAATGLFQEFIGVFLAAGKKLNDRDVERARKLWRNFNAPEHAAILEHLKRSVVDGTWSDALHTPMPASYLASKAWTRIGPGRVLPHPPQKESKVKPRYAGPLNASDKEHGDAGDSRSYGPVERDPVFPVE